MRKSFEDSWMFVGDRLDDLNFFGLSELACQPAGRKRYEAANQLGNDPR